MNSSKNSSFRKNPRASQRHSKPSTSKGGVRLQTARKSTALPPEKYRVKHAGSQRQPKPSTSKGEVRQQTARKSTALPPGKYHVKHATAGLSSSPSKVRREAEIDKLAHECVYYLLIADQKKYPIKKIDIVKHVMEKKGKLYSNVIKRAKELLTETFGLKLIEVSDKKDCYIICNQHKQLDLSEYQDTELDQRGLLYVILSAIHIGRAPLHEENLWKMLNSMGIKDLVKDPFLGDVKKLVTHEWVRQLYLKRDTIINSEPAEFQYSFGFRAENEVDDNLLESFCQKVKNRDDSHLLSNLQDLGE